MVFINASQSLGLILLHGSQNVTGGIVVTLFFVFILLIIIAMMFSIPFEFTALTLSYNLSDEENLVVFSLRFLF